MIQQSYSWVYIQTKLIQKDTRTPMFTAALYTIAKTGKPPKRLSSNRWMEKDVLPHHRKEWNNTIGSNMDEIRLSYKVK